MPACRCSDCILSPEDSHGIHLIGAYSPKVYLSRRGGTNPPGVSYFMPWSPGADGGRGSIRRLLPSVDSDHYTINV